MNTFDTGDGDRNTRRKVPPAYRFALLPLSLPRRPARLPPPPSRFALRQRGTLSERLRLPSSPSSRAPCSRHSSYRFGTPGIGARQHVIRRRLQQPPLFVASLVIKYVYRIHEIYPSASVIGRIESLAGP